MFHRNRGFDLLVIASVAVMLQACSLLPGAKTKNGAVNGTEVPLIELELSGVEDRLADNVRAHVSATRKPCTIARAYANALERRAHEETQDALRALGYYSPQISVAMDYAGDCPRMRIDVVPGEPVRLGKIDVDIRGPAGDDEPFRAQLGDLGLVSGEPLDHQRYSDAKKLIESTALERGYLEGVFVTRRLAVEPAARRADVTLVYDSGPRYTFGPIAIVQDPEFLDESLVRRFINDREGDPYLASHVAGFHRALSKGSYFESIDVRPRLASPVGETIPVEITLTPRKQHRISSGIGASTDEGIRGRVAYLNRRLNRYGHQFDVEVKASLIEQKFSLGYALPRAHPVDEWLTLQAGLRHRDVDSFNTIETQTVLSETKQRPFRWMETRYIEFNHENFDVSGTDDTTTFLAPGIKWRRVVADHDLFPTSGLSVELEFKGAAEQAVSDTSFAKSMLRVSSITSLITDVRLILRGRFGAMWVDDFSKLPPSERFFAGGDNSIRGYDIDSLGPVDASNDVIGGTQLAVVTAEMDYYFFDNWGVAIFVDGGNAYGGDGSATGVQTGVGIGARWRSPVGPIRVDFAHPLDDPNNDFRLHLRIGPDF